MVDDPRIYLKINLIAKEKYSVHNLREMRYFSLEKEMWSI